MTRFAIALVLVLTLVTPVQVARGHCQMPCGIYGDEARFGQMAEDLDTLEKAMKQIQELSAKPAENQNQLVRWVNTKEQHADDLAHTLSFYFLQQRIPLPKEGDEAAKKHYDELLELTHRMLVHVMKAKQTTDLAHVQALRKTLESFQHAYKAK